MSTTSSPVEQLSIPNGFRVVLGTALGERIFVGPVSIEVYAVEAPVEEAGTRRKPVQFEWPDLPSDSAEFLAALYASRKGGARASALVLSGERFSINTLAARAQCDRGTVGRALDDLTLAGCHLERSGDFVRLTSVGRLEDAATARSLRGRGAAAAS